MPQSLIRMPETADIPVFKWRIIIRNHKVVSRDGLIGRIVRFASDSDSRGDTLSEFEKYGVSFEAAIEYCAAELEHDSKLLTDVIYWSYGIREIRDEIIQNNWKLIVDLSKRDAGKAIASQYIEKIRSCDNWQQLLDEMKQTSRFTKDMKKIVKMEIEKTCRRV